MIGLPIVLLGVAQHHAKIGIRAEEPRDGEVQIDRGKLHPETEPGPAAPGNQIAVEALAVFDPGPALRLKLPRMLEYLRVVVGVLRRGGDGGLERG